MKTFKNDSLIMNILDLCGMLEIDELEALISNIECMIDNKKEEEE
jgi:hypothetical protein